MQRKFSIQPSSNVNYPPDQEILHRKLSVQHMPSAVPSTQYPLNQKYQVQQPIYEVVPSTNYQQSEQSKADHFNQQMYRQNEPDQSFHSVPVSVEQFPGTTRMPSYQEQQQQPVYQSNIIPTDTYRKLSEQVPLQNYQMADQSQSAPQSRVGILPSSVHELNVSHRESYPIRNNYTSPHRVINQINQRPISPYSNVIQGSKIVSPQRQYTSNLSNQISITPKPTVSNVPSIIQYDHNSTSSQNSLNSNPIVNNLRGPSCQCSKPTYNTYQPQYTTLPIQSNPPPTYNITNQNQLSQNNQQWIQPVAPASQIEIQPTQFPKSGENIEIQQPVIPFPQQQMVPQRQVITQPQQVIVQQQQQPIVQPEVVDDQKVATTEGHFNENPTAMEKRLKRSGTRRRSNKTSSDKPSKLSVLSVVNSSIVECQLDSSKQKTVTFKFDIDDMNPTEIANKLVSCL